jgi:hypothetical protein
MVLEENSDGADVFWPGYVDAVTNLVLNLLFMLTIMIVAVFMFALELSRHKDDNPVPVVKSPAVEAKSATDTDETAQLNLKAKDEKIALLERELQTLRKETLDKLPQDKLAVKNDQRSTQKIVIVKTPLTEAEKRLQQTPSNGGAVVVQFLNESVTLTSTEEESVRKALGDIAKKRSARIVVEAPSGFSEAKRLGYYRAMAIRNQLITLNVPADKIDVSVVEGKSSADNTKVMVMEQ